jgi:valyl-tRNA synthetase
LRLIQGWETVEDENADNKVMIEWFESKLSKTITELESQFEQFRLSEALMTLYKFIWDDFCSWYLELIKPDYQQPIDRFTHQKTNELFEKLMQLLHPFMPFITEEIWHSLQERKAGESVNFTSYPRAKKVNENLLEQAELAFGLITNIREIRAKANKKNSENVDVYFAENNFITSPAFANKIIKSARLGKFEKTTGELPGAKTFIIKGCQFFVATGETANAGEERKKLMEELAYARGFLESVEKKLANERFMASAPPQVVEGERQKREDALKKIALLEESLLSH